MAYNFEFLREKYQDTTREEGRFLESRAAGLEAHYTKKQLDLLVNKQSSVLELGCGPGYYGLYLADKCREYLGIDIMPENVERFSERIKEGNYKNLSVETGDAICLDFVPAETYDVVLVLGPMYHLPTKDRELVFKESIRVCKPGGKICFAYVSMLGVYAGACILAPERYPNAHTNECLFVYGVNDLRPDLFFLTTPEEMERSAKEHGLCIIKNVGLDFFFAANLINNMSEEQFDAWMVLNDRIAESGYCTGLSNHALLVCEKVF
ncbi:MAG: class I SAM-dependent methyltransferase [Eubacteriales bacterium]|jgi:ubiquinone/menaquinone biosynthesis C-methylase UbiE|nr:class I SAM-dependent methyltransferase [Eubacteriales bacterium]